MRWLGGSARRLAVTAIVTVMLVVAALPALASADIPPAAPTLETIPAGSLVIPMDSAKQNLDGKPFNIKAYGLAAHLLWDEIALRWAIRAGKQKDEADFTAMAERILPTPLAAASVAFSAGPLVILARDVSAAMPVINAFAGNVAIYRLTADTTVDVRHTLLHKPKIAVLDDGGNAHIHSDILDDAGFIAGVHYGEISATTLTTINANSCYTIATEPHFNASGTAANPQAQAIRTFALSGGNFLAQCAATKTYENNVAFGLYQTTAGFTDTTTITNALRYPTPDFAFSQINGPLKKIGGSVSEFIRASGSNFRNGAHVHVEHTDSSGAYVATAAKLTAGKGSMVFYLGGHSYGDDALDEINGLRMYLNAILTPALRPPPCDLDFSEAPDEINGEIFEDVDGNGDPADGVRRPGVTVRLYRDGGDNAPTGADDTLVGTTTTDSVGSYGFAALTPGSFYWVAVDSRTMSPSAGLNGGFGAADAWPEQTYGANGARCDNGISGTALLTLAGPCFGGKTRDASDRPTTLGTSEHVALTAPGRAGRHADFGFSFATIVTARDGDDDASARTIQGSLRQFLLNSNAVVGLQRTTFRLAGSTAASVTWRIAPTTALPEVTDATVLDAATQPGFAGSPLVELDGSAGRPGLVVKSGASTIRSLAINRFNGAGVTLDTNDGNRVEGCYIGTNIAGTSALANGDVGVLVRSDANAIGGTTAAQRNIISGNVKAGVKLDNGATGNVVSGNYIGTNAAGAAALGNDDVGIEIRGTGNTIGGTAAGSGNVISANQNGGIKTTGGGAGGNTIYGNAIGINATGTGALGNAGPGIDLRSANNRIGGTSAGMRNVISGNATGINIAGNGATANSILGNFIGTDSSGSSALGNTQDGIAIDTASNNVVGGTAAGAGNVIAHSGGAGILVTRQPVGNIFRGNSIHGNGGLGIDLENDGVTLNDTDDADIGPNDLQNFPLLNSVTVLGTTTTIVGTMNSIPNATFALDFFASDSIDPTNHGEGQRYLGSANTTTNGSGNASFTAVLTGRVNTGEVVSATATAPDNSTSEFSRIFTFSPVSGKVVEDVDGDGNLSDAVGRPSVTVKLYQDGGDGQPTGVDDVLVGSTTTDANGDYTIVSVLSGTYWVAVDSRTVAPSAGFNAGSSQGNVWPEQTQGSAGAQCDNGAGGSIVLSTPGTCYGGRRSSVSDNAGALVTSEHVTRISVVATGIADVDFAFSFRVVSNTRDGDDDLSATRSVQGSFRQLVQNGNAIAGAASSVFRIPQSDTGYNGTGSGEYSIKPTSPFPDITDLLVVDGSTQPGWTAAPIVELNGRNAGNAANGLRVTAGNCMVRALVINQFKRNGIELSGPGGNQIQGCYIGTTASGATADDNSRHGIEILGPNNTIGGTTAGTGNVISGNTLDGILIFGAAATGNTVQGNRIGTNVAGTAALRNNDNGVELAAGASTNRIGGSSPGARNVISGNHDDGVHITDLGTNGNIIEGNYVGLNLAGSAAIGNGHNGVFVDDSASNTTIGGVAPGTGNVISGNVDNGVEISGTAALGPNFVQGNLIGIDATGAIAVGNAKVGVEVSSGAQNQVGGTAPGAGNKIAWNLKEGVVVMNNATACAIQQNSIHDNLQLGIDLRPTGVAVNDLNDGDTGPNDLQNFPVLTSVTTAGGSTTIGGTVNSRPSAVLTLEFFSSPAADPLGYGEGEIFLGNTSVTTDAAGNATFATTLPVAVPISHVVTATATNAGNKTSEFSAAHAVMGQVDLSLTKSASDTTPVVGGAVTFTVTLTNAAGTTSATGVVVTDLLPAGYTYVSDDAASTGTSYVPATGVWTVGSLAAGSSIALTITTQVNVAGPYLNVAEVTAAAPSDVDSVPGDGTGDDYAGASTNPVTLIDLALTKSVDRATPTVGTDVVFTVTVSNDAGAGYATGVVVQDLLPAGYSFVSDDSASTGTSYAPATGLWTVGDLAAGAGATLHLTARVNGSGPWANVAEVVAAGQPDLDSTPGDGSGDDFASAVTAPVAPIDLSLTKSVDNVAPGVGTNVVFKLELSNASGFAVATGVIVRDALPSGYTYISDDSASTGTTYSPSTGAWTVGNAATGSSIGLKITARVNAAGIYVNAAEVIAAGEPDIDSTPDDGQGDDFATAVTTPDARVDLSLTKTVDVAVPPVGSSIVFTLTVSNAATADSASDVIVTDRLPSGYRYLSDDGAATGTTYSPVTGEWNVGKILAGADVTLRITALVRGTGTHVNAAEVTGVDQPDLDSTPGDGTGDDFATASTTPVLPTIDLSLTKTVSNATPPTGSTVTFTLTASNADGFSPASDIVVTDRLPSGYAYVSDDGAGAYDPVSGAWAVGSLVEASSAVLHVTATVNPSGAYLNAAEITAAGQPDVDSTPGDATGDDYATAGTTPQPVIDLSLTKTVDTAAPPVGTNVVFTVTVANANGLNDATGVVVTDALPAGYQYVSDDSATTGTTYVAGSGVWTVGNLAAGSSRALSITAKVLAAGPYLNSAEVSAADQTDIDSSPGDGAGDDRASASVAASPRIDLSLENTVDDPAPPMGASVVFKLTLINAAGSSNATGVTVTDLLPAGYRYTSDDSATTGTSYSPATGVWTVGSVAAGTSRALKIRATVLPSGPWTSVAEVTAAAETDIDSTPGDGTGDDYTAVDVEPVVLVDLSLAKNVDVVNPLVGANVVFTVTVANEAGLSTATGVVVSDLLPSGYRYVSDDSASTTTTYTPASGVWNVGSVPGGASVALHLTATVLPTGEYENAAEVTAAVEPDVDSSPGNGAGLGEDDGATRSTAPLGADGTVEITERSYPGESLVVTVSDADLNLDPTVVETVQVPVINETTGETELLTLTETAASSGVFQGSLATVFGTVAGPAGDGILTVQAGDAILATYQDARTTTGRATARTDTGGVAGGVNGALDFTARSLPGDTLLVTVTDADLNTDSATVETVQTPVVDNATEETETVTLIETGADTGVFTATLPTAAGETTGQSGDGILFTRIGDTLTATYSDTLTEAGGAASVLAQSLVGGDAVRLVKTAGKTRVVVGEVIPYTIRATSTLAVTGVTIQDVIPAGFKYVENSARLTRAGPDDVLGTTDDVSTPLATTGSRPIDLGPFNLAAGESVDVSYLLRVGAGAGQGDHENVATPLQSGLGVGSAASAWVAVVADPVFDQSTIIGKVFQDGNRNDWQDPGEEGVPHAMVVLDDGTYVTTDDFGRFHFPATNPGQRMVKLNIGSLPLGSEITSEESRILWITPGVPVRADFGVIIPEPAERTIGAPGAKGVAVSGGLEPTPIEVRGNVSDVTVLVNDTLVPLSTSDVKLEVKPIGEVIQLVGNALPDPVSFRLRAEANDRVERWSLQIIDESLQAVKTIAGTGALPDAVTWDAKTDAGEMVASGEIYRYQLSLHYVDGSISHSATRIFGVNRETVLSLELTGDAFATGNAELTAGARKTLDRAAGVLAEYPREKVVIEGHTDSVGNAVSNLELSKRRAEAARDYLVTTHGVAAERLTLQWFGEDRPKVGNDDAEGRALNRRVEIKGEVQRVESADLNARVRTEPFVYINKAQVPIAAGGRFAATVPAAGVDALEVELANGQGRSVFQMVSLPGLELELPQGDVVATNGAQASRCVRAADAGAGDGAARSVVCRVVGTTDAGNSLLLDGKQVPVAADGSFSSEVAVGPGRTTYPIIVRNAAGVSRGANLVMSLSDRDRSGNLVIVSQAVPNLTLNLPPDGTRLPSRKLQIAGTTDAGNQVLANGQPLTVAADGKIEGSVDLPPGRSRVVVEVKDQNGGTGQIESEYDVPRHELFLLAFADGEFGRMSGSGLIEAAGQDEDDEYYAEGRVAFYLKGVIAGKYLITSSFDSDRQSNGTVFRDLNGAEGTRLLTNLDPDRYYPVYGDDSSLVYDVESQGKFYLALDSDTMSAVVGNYPLALKDTELAAYQRTLYGARYAYRSLSRSAYGDPDTSVVVFGAQVRQAHVRDELRATGGSLYYLSHQEIVEGSEQVYLVIRDKNTGLFRSQEPQRLNVDYTIKYPEGRLLFLRPIASVVHGGSITDQNILSGDPVYVQVDYEAAVQGFEKTAEGARARQQIGDHVSVGGTYINGELQSGEYELQGLDTEVRLGKSTRLVAEYAKSTGTDALAYRSDDGGLSYTTIAASGMEEGSALKVAAEVDIGEWFRKPDRYRARFYYKDLEPGFFSNGNFQEQGTTKVGVSADLTITDRDTLRVRYDQEERTGAAANIPGATRDTDLSAVQWEHREDRWGAIGELFQSDVKDVQGSSLGESSLVAARGWLKFTEKITGTLEHQETLDGVANDQTTAGVQYQVLPSLALEAKGTDGSRGSSAEAGAVLTLGETSVYLTERAASDQAGDRTVMVLGARSPLGASSRVYTEYQWEDTDTGQNAISLVGLQRQWEVGPGLRFVLSGENAHVKSSTSTNPSTTATATERDRSALAASVSYEKPESWLVSSRNEIRFDDGVPNTGQPATPGNGRRRQVLTYNQFSYKLNEDLSLVGKLAYSSTENRDTGATEAKLDEQSVGIAYRPVASDRFNALGRYTRLRDLRPGGVGNPVATDRTLDVLSAETIFRINPRVEWAAKAVARMQEEAFAGLGPIETDSYMTIQRFNINVWNPFDIGVEYRILTQRQTEDQRQGWLGEVMWKPIKYFRVGLGYNFTDFSDDEFSTNDYSQNGWFLRVQGRY